MVGYMDSTVHGVPMDPCMVGSLEGEDILRYPIVDEGIGLLKIKVLKIR